jgi:uncharacterized protein (DUF305 family)
MRNALLLAAVLITIATACDRRPVQKDLPVKNAPQNSVDHSGVHHSSIESSPGAAASGDELQFIDTMIPHDEGTIDIAQLVQTRAAHPELKSLAADLIRDRQKEITALREWRSQYFKDAAPAINTDLAGMRTAVDQLDPDRLDPLKENAFDTEFLKEMLPQLEADVEMARYILTKPLGQPAELRDPLRSLAQSMLDSRSAEIVRIKSWQQAWSKQP